MKTIKESLTGKVVVISGGTRGIGFATVTSFLENGAKVALLGSRQQTVDEAIKKIKDIDESYEVLGFCPTLTNVHEINRMVELIVKAWGTIDILINNAGISDATPLHMYDDEHFDQVIDINLKSVFLMTRAVTPIMKKAGHGVILNTSSMVSIYGQKSGCAYPTSKFAVNGLTKSLARELGSFGIRVNAVAPGITETDMVAALDQKIIAAMEAQIPLKRVGKPEDVADAFLFLASDMASYISGVVLSVDGAIVS